MTKYSVTFLPDKKTVEVEEGITLLEAAEQAEVYINSLCGGQGICGECRLQVMKGNAKADKHSVGFFTADEIMNGYVLACQTPVHGDLEVLIPSRSRLEMEKIITEGAPVSYGEPEKIALHRIAYDPASISGPLVTKIYLELPQPTLEDNIDDIDRVTRELKKKLDYPSFEISLSCLQNLAERLRDNDWKITVTVARHEKAGRILHIDGGDTSKSNYGLAVDVGTTTVVVQMINLQTGQVVGVEANHNLQARYGEDVISRMIFACSRGSLPPLQEAIITNINALVKAITKEKGIDFKDITCMVAGGNSTMSHFLLGLMPCNLRLEPYVPTANIFPQILAKEIGITINPNGIAEVIPGVASYIGGDTTAGVLAAGIHEKPEIRCLIDVGTNAEIVVGNNEWLVCASASAGPAFEGGGTKWGMRATKGAIEKVEIEKGQVTLQTIANARPRGICGSGLIDSIYELARNRIIGQNGKFNTAINDKRIIFEDDIPQYVLAFPEETESGRPVTITETDISNLIRSKGAVFAATKSLLDYVGLGFKQLETLYVAGGFGSSLNVPKAIAIGLLPDIPPEKVQFLGNSCIMGVRMALLSRVAFESAINISKKMTNIELSNYPPFMNEFVAALFLPHTDGKLFPSVHYEVVD